MEYDEWRGSMDGRPTLYVKRLISWRGRRVDIHKMVAADDPGCFHSHPALAVRVVLAGGYAEELPDGTRKTWRPGMVGLVRPEYSHRIAYLCNGRCSFSLWIRFRKSAPVRLTGYGWKRQAQTHRVEGTILSAEAK